MHSAVTGKTTEIITMTREEIYHGIVCLQSGKIELEARNFIDGLPLIHEFNRIVVPYIARLEKTFKRNIQIVGGYLSSTLYKNGVDCIPPHVLGFAKDHMTCVFIILKPYEAKTLKNIQHIYDNTYCIYIS